ncbi:MAG: RNA polymerase factor sigma-32 [Desulfobacterales bacterium]
MKMLEKEKAAQKIRHIRVAQKKGEATNLDAKKSVSAVTTTKKPKQMPNRELQADTLKSYLSSIGKYNLLTRDQERELALRLRKNDDRRATHILITANLRLVVKIALGYKRLWMQNLMDLIQEGNIGLIKAVEKFDPDKNVKFSYYASFWIKAYIIKHLMDNFRLVKIGTTQAQRKLFFRLKKEKQKLWDMGFEPKPELISKRLGVSKKDVIEMEQRISASDVSLDAPLKDDLETARIEFMRTSTEPIEEKISRKEIYVILHRGIAKFRKEMNKRELDIFDQRIFAENPKTLAEIGKQYGISRERVRQIQKVIILKMKDSLRHTLPDYAAHAEGFGDF